MPRMAIYDPKAQENVHIDFCKVCAKNLTVQEVRDFLADRHQKDLAVTAPSGKINEAIEEVATGGCDHPPYQEGDTDGEKVTCPRCGDDLDEVDN